jgi:hypothetical protein
MFKKGEGMLHHDWMLSRLAEEHRRDLMRQSEQDRLVRLADFDGHQHGHTIYHALDLVGRQLIVLGERLCARHALAHSQSLTHTTGG